VSDVRIDEGEMDERYNAGFAAGMEYARWAIEPVARDLLRRWKQDHACPLCDAVSPICQHVAGAERLRVKR
jgi:hypothetical protein